MSHSHLREQILIFSFENTLTTIECIIKYTADRDACMLKTERKKEEGESKLYKHVSLWGADRESRIIYMVMRKEEWRYNQGLVHRKCQALNKNKAARTAPITNTRNSCQTNTL